MILELLGPVLMAGLMGYNIVRSTALFDKDVEKLLNDTVPILENPIVSNSPQCELIVELLRADEEWNKTRHGMGGANARYVHQSGVRVCVSSENLRYGGSPIYSADILDDNNIWHTAGISNAEFKLIAKEIEAYETRARDRKQRELTAALARRIAGGTVPPVLAGTKLLGPPPADEDCTGGSDSVSSGSISFDKQTGKVVASMRGDNVKLNMDATFRGRYLNEDEVRNMDKSTRELAESLGMIRNSGPLRPQKVMK